MGFERVSGEIEVVAVAKERDVLHRRTGLHDRVEGGVVSTGIEPQENLRVAQHGLDQHRDVWLTRRIAGEALALEVDDRRVALDELLFRRRRWVRFGRDKVSLLRGDAERCEFRKQDERDKKREQDQTEPGTSLFHTARRSLKVAPECSRGHKRRLPGCSNNRSMHVIVHHPTGTFRMLAGPEREPRSRAASPGCHSSQQRKSDIYVI